MPFFTQWGGISEAAALGLQSWFTFCVFLLEVPTGVVADKYGRKHSAALGCLSVAVATLVYSAAPRLELFVVAEFLFALGVALISGADKALLHDHLIQLDRASDSSALWGKSRSFHLAGILLAAPIGGVIAAKWGLNFPMLATFIPAVLSAVVVWSIPEPPVHTPPGAMEKGIFRLGIDGIKVLRGHPVLLRWTINSTLVSAAAYYVIWFYQPMMSGLDIPVKYFGLGHVALVASELIASSTIRNRFALTAIATSVAIAVAALWPGHLTLAILLVIGGGLGLTRAELMSGEMNRYIQSHNRATVHSAISMYRRIIQALLNPGMGLVLAASLPLALGLVSIIPLLTLFFPLNGQDHHT